VKRLTLLTRPGCHLCEDARIAVRSATAGTDTQVQEIDVDGDPELRGEYGDMVPVVLIDGVQHAYFTVDAAKLERALRA
jgi:glutaredoxin